MSKFYRSLITAQVEQYAEPWAVKYVTPAFAGDAEAAFSLCVALSNSKRGEVAVAMWRAKVPREAFRSYFASAWDHDHRHVINAAGTRHRLAYLFRYAAFPVPAGLPDVVRVWRGTSKLTQADACSGYSWTTCRDVACWFAMRFAAGNGVPLVLAADVPKSDIALHHDERNEHEVVLLRPPRAWVDGQEADWLAGHARRQVAQS